VEANKLFGPAGRVLLAVSGGADSTALLYVFSALKGEGIVGAGLFCGHVNHQLRADAADADEAFVVEQAERLGIEVRTRLVDVRGYARGMKLSIETAARELRIKSLRDIAQKCDCEVVATGHQKNDNAETVLQRLSRGTGIRGLGGIRPSRSFGETRFARPLLCVRREEIIEYLEGRGLGWREDRTNLDCAHRRNFIRRRLLPGLQEECNGSIVEQLHVLAGSARGYYRVVCGRADEVWADLAGFREGEVVIDCGGLSVEAEAVRVELIRRALRTLGSGERDMRQEHYERILELAEQNVGGRRVELPGGFSVRREYGKVIFEKAGMGRDRPAEEEVELEVPGSTLFGEHVIEANILGASEEVDSRILGNSETGVRCVERFDLDKIKLPLLVRGRRDGDRFVPLGASAEKKVGKFLTDARVRREVRRKVLVVEDGEKVIWVWPVRMTEQAKITGQTTKVLEMKIAIRSTRGQGKELGR